MPSWFQRKDQFAIPSVNDQPPRGAPPPRQPPNPRGNYSSYNPYKPTTDASVQSYTSSSSTLVAAGPGREASSGGAGPGAGGYGRNRPLDPYSKGERNIDEDRNALFAGRNTENAPTRNRFVDGPPGRRSPPPGEENDEDVEGIKQQTRFIKQDSASSTRNALRLAQEAEETARNTLGRLADQSEKIADTERYLDKAKGHSKRAEDNTNEIKKLNRSIFIPVITWDKSGKRAAEELKRKQRHEEEQQERENGLKEVRESQNRLGNASAYGRGGDEEGIGREAQKNVRKAQRSRFQFEATASDDELEDEIDDNLAAIAHTTKQLKNLSVTMGSELDNQNERLTRIEGKTTKLDQQVISNTDKLKRIH